MLPPNCVTAGVVVSAICLCIGVPLGVGWPFLFSSILKFELQLSSTSVMFAALGSESPINVYMDIYLWNFTNGAEFEANKSITPRFDEVGPFVFKLTSERVNVTWNHNFTVSFSPKQKYMFVPEESIDFKTLITTIHPIPAVLARYTKWWESGLFKSVINKELELREKFLKTDTAENWLFYGIQDSLIELMVPLSKVIKFNLPGDKFAWFYGKNDTTSSGELTMNTGADNLEKVGEITHWNGENTSSVYTGVCGAIGGSSGQAFPHYETRPDFVSVFATDACSQVSLQADGDTEIDGITGWRFVGGDTTLDNGTLHSENSCFCTGECTPTGVRNVSDCKSGAPAFVSFPHFYQADESFRSAIDGMNPCQSLHETTLVIEPVIGVPIFAHIQLQVNMMIEASDSVSFYKDMPRVYVPVLWFRQRVELTPRIISLIKVVLSLPTVGLAVFCTIALIGLVGLIVFLRLEMKLRKSPSQLPTQEDISVPKTRRPSPKILSYKSRGVEFHSHK